MQFFDGRIEGLKSLDPKMLNTDEVKARFPTGGTPLKVAFSITWLVFLGFLISMIPFMLISIAFGVMNEPSTGFSFFLGIFLFIFVIIGIPSMLIIFLITLFTSRKQIEKNFTIVTNDFIEIQFWKGKKNIPVQITRIPYRYIKDVHVITNDEWKNELHMGNILRRIGMWPLKDPSGRFHSGVFRKDLYTIQFSERKELHDYVEKQGTLGVLLTLFVSVLFSSTDMNLEEQIGVDERMYVSISRKDIEKLKKLIEDQKNNIDNYSSSSESGYNNTSDNQEIVDDSWFTDENWK